MLNADPDAPLPSARAAWTTLALGIALGWTCFAATALWMHGPTPLPRGALLAGAALAAALAAVAWWPATRAQRSSALALTVLLAALTWMSTAILVNLSFYLRVPVDLVGFYETQYLTDIIRWRTHQPLYGEPLDNNSCVYTPLAQIVTSTLAELVGRANSIPTLRTISFGQVFVAAAFAAAGVDALVRHFLRAQSYAWRAVWIAASFLALLCVATDPVFNQNVHQLHPDALTLSLSTAAFWLCARDLRKPSLLNALAMAALPAVGFWAKQSLLIWGALFGAQLLLGGRARRRDFAVYAVVSIALLAASLTLLRSIGGPFTFFWTVDALARKHVTLSRSLGNLSGAGVYVALSLIAGFALAWRSRERVALVMWLGGMLLLCVEGYTSGFAYQSNHMGPGVMIASAWSLAALVWAWQGIAQVDDTRERGARFALAAAALVLVLAGLGLVREPRSSVPTTLGAYIAAIESEFVGVEPERLLLDRGAWPCLSRNQVMKDRTNTVAVHVGDNQELDHAALAGTLQRIRTRAYDKILVWFLDEGSGYDYGKRGSGIKDALLENYTEVRRIPGVKVTTWWPPHMLAEVSVLVPRGEASAPSDR